MRFLAPFSLLIIVSTSLSIVFAKDYKMAMIGNFHGDEIKLENGDKVFTFTESKLEEATVEVLSVRDDLLDENGEESGKFVKLAGDQSDKKVWLLLKGDFKAGLVENTSIDRKRCFPTEFIEKKYDPHDEGVARIGVIPPTGILCKFLLNGREHTFKVKKYIDHSSFGSGKSIDFEITDDKGVGYTYENVSEIAWLGDLNRDGKLDLILDYNNHYNIVSSFRLYLSSEKDGEAPVEVARFQAVGC